MLWIAFKLSSLLYLYQPLHCPSPPPARCELLSNWVLCYIYTSILVLKNWLQQVVNCFQIEFFVIFIPALSFFNMWRSLLWIAFKLSSLLYLYQRRTKTIDMKASCELLSNWVLCYIYTSDHVIMDEPIEVVNCFQIEFFVIFIPAIHLTYPDKLVLWIAFKLSSLLYLYQLKQIRNIIMICCELLSNWVLCYIYTS